MSITPVGSSTNTAAAHATSAVQQQQHAKAPQKAPAAVTVSISKQAQTLASDGDTQAQEIRESGAEKASESVRKRA
jgi:hypothetical protein